MKKNRLLKIIIAISISLTLVAPHSFLIGNVSASTPTSQVSPLDTDFTYFMKNKAAIVALDKTNGDATITKSLGEVPAPFKLPASSTSKIIDQAVTYPTSYDLRTFDKITSVKDQSTSGSCWAFATCASLESILSPGENRDFSENNLKNTSGFDIDPNSGGNRDMSTAYLSRWSGPINESDDLFNPSSTVSPADKTVQKHIQEVIWLPDRKSSLDNDGIKNSLMTYGAVQTSMYWDSYCYNAANCTYFKSIKPSPATNHGVTIVGWDDNFDRTKFYDSYTGTMPAGNGAYIIKNSWGNSWGKSGCFYISYYDVCMGVSNTVYNGAEAATNYKNIYQYDKLGLVDTYGYTSTTGWFANVFTANSSEDLTAVSFYTPVINSSYEVYVCTDYTNSASLYSSRILKGSGTIANPGYHTIKLDSGENLTAGNKFAVIVKLTTPGYTYPIPIEYAISGYSSGATANAGEGYMGYNGESWTDATASVAGTTTSICLKAFTSMAETNAARPVITTQPTDVMVSVGGTATLSLTATSAKGTLSYQWYSNTTKTNNNGTAISGATGSSYSAPTTTAGTYYYYCVVTNTDDTVSGSKTAATNSDALSVEINNGTNGNLAAGKVPTSSYSVANISRLTDGNKDTKIYYGTTTGKQWVQLDLGASYNLNDIKLWHYFADARKYHDVIVQLSNDSTFKTGVTTVFNNDADNTAGLGLSAGTDIEYAETSTGKDISFGSVNARYLRLYSNGSTANAWNHYIEVEVYESDGTVIHSTSVTLNKTTDSIAIGATDKLTPTFTPADTTNKNVTWASSDEAIASVSKDGTVTGLKNGTATITVTTEDGGYTAACKVNVGNLAAGKVPSASYSLANISRLTDGNKDTKIYYGTTTGKQWVQLDLGTNYILNDIKLWHYFADPRKYHDVIVQLSNDSTFKTAVTTVFNNDTDNSAGLGLSAGTDTEYAETSAGKDIPVASVNARYLRLYSNGSTANAWNHYVEVEVYGSDVPAVIYPTSVNLDKTSDSIAIGATDKLTPIFTPADTTNKNVTWSSSDEAIASVSTDGTVTGVKSGAATITVKTEDGGITATCKVNVGNLAYGKVPTSSYSVANISRLTDGAKNTNTYYGTTTGLQWVQLDLGNNYNLNDIKLWHYFGDTRKYHDLVVQLSNDPNFATGVSTVYNNDTDNSSGLDTGKDSEYAETSIGKDISFDAVNARYARFYSNGSTANAYNHYVEIEIYGSSD